MPAPTTGTGAPNVVASAETVAPAAEEASTAVVALAPTRSAIRENGTISGSSAIDRMIESAAAEHGVPRELAFGVVHVESRYNPRAKGRGVYGLSQIMPSTARSLGFSGPTEALYDPETNLRYGMKYLKGAWEKGGRDICRASMKYKGGHRATTMTKSAATYCANVKRHIASIGGNPGRLAEPAVMVAAAEPVVPTPAPAAETRAPVIAASVAMAPTVRPTSPAIAAIEAQRNDGSTSPATVNAAEPADTGSSSAAAAAVTTVATPPESEAEEVALGLRGPVGGDVETETPLLQSAVAVEPDAGRFGD